MDGVTRLLRSRGWPNHWYCDLDEKMHKKKGFEGSITIKYVRDGLNYVIN
jgi:hypothetical protein